MIWMSILMGTLGAIAGGIWGYAGESDGKFSCFMKTVCGMVAGILIALVLVWF